MKEKLEFVAVFFRWFHCFAFALVPHFNLLECFVVQLAECFGVLAQGEEFLGAQHEYQNTSKIKIERAIVVLAASLLIRELGVLYDIVLAVFHEDDPDFFGWVALRAAL